MHKPRAVHVYNNLSVRKEILCTVDGGHIGCSIHQCSCCGSHLSDFRDAKVNFTRQTRAPSNEASAGCKTQPGCSNLHNLTLSGTFPISLGHWKKTSLILCTGHKGLAQPNIHSIIVLTSMPFFRPCNTK